MKWIPMLVVSTLATGAASAAVKVACVGNSITYGSGTTNHTTKSPPSDLQNLLGSGFAVVNYGVSSRTVLKKGDLPYWNRSEYKNALASLPGIVIIELGTNDSKLALNWTPHQADFEGDFIAFVASFQALSSKPQIWLNTCPPACKVSYDIHEATLATGVNPRILQTALATESNLIDIHAALTGECANYSGDGIHPNDAGSLLLAKAVYAALTHKPGSIASTNGVLTAPKAYAYQWYQDGVPIAASSGGAMSTLKPSKAANYSVSLKIDSLAETRIVTDKFVVASAGILPKVKVDDVVKVETVGRSLRVARPDGSTVSGRLTVRDLAGRVIISSMIPFASSDFAIPSSVRGLIVWQLEMPGRAVSGTAAVVE